MFSKTDKNYLIDVSLAIIALVCILTGLGLSLKPAALMPLLTAIKMKSLHEWTGYAMLVLVILHLVMHTQWINAVTKTITEKKNKVIALALTIVLSVGLCAAISILSPEQKKPGGMPNPQQTAQQTPKAN